jgi:Ni,Fe-hydrogenase III small subunit/formate hydrogenlyase subunit 6/NADH:ubiquinone oxidoreductase subunit I
MIRTVLARLRQGYRTIGFPDAPPPPMPDRFRGRARIDAARCPKDCRQCEQACPTSAIRRDETPSADPANRLRVDLGRCLFCEDCSRACPHGLVRHEGDYRLAARRRDDLLVGDAPLPPAAALEESMRRLLGRSLRLRQVSAGGCNACEADANVLSTIGWDLGRFGVQFVASPRHADGLLITGPVTDNMKLALEKTYRAVPGPKIVIASGACAISGGPYIDHPEVHNGASAVVPVDLFVPGCPPHPLTLLDGLLRLIGRIRP